MVLQAFFDETGGDEKAAVTAVAGFVYDKPGLKHFIENWALKINGLSKPYRSALCNAGRPPFEPPDWPEDRRQGLMDELGQLSAGTALAGFVVATTYADYQGALENGPGIRKVIDSPYTLCTISLLSAVAQWANSFDPSKLIYCSFEAGGYHWKQAKTLIERIPNSGGAEQFSSIAGQTWAPKEDAPAFCSADLLAWEWQRNVLRSPNQWTPRIADMFTRMRENSKPILAEHMTANSATTWALFNAVYGLIRS